MSDKFAQMWIYIQGHRPAGVLQSFINQNWSLSNHNFTFINSCTKKCMYSNPRKKKKDPLCILKGLAGLTACNRRLAVRSNSLVPFHNSVLILSQCLKCKKQFCENCTRQLVRYLDDIVWFLFRTILQAIYMVCFCNTDIHSW